MKKICVLSFVLLFLTSLSFAGTINLPRTGQTKCWDTNGIKIPCIGTGQDGEIQVGVAWPDPRFTTNADTTIQDNLTGLVWAPNGNIIPTRDPGWDTDGTTNDGLVTWQHALDYVAKLNSENYLGLADWRLPNVNELESLVNADLADTSAWLNTQGFTNVQAFVYWSSTSYADDPRYAGIVGMRNGGTGESTKFGGSYYVWPVRSGQDGIISLPKTGQKNCYDTLGNEIPCAGTGQDGEIQAGVAWPSPRFTDNGDDTVTDNLTGLMWTKTIYLSHSITWQHALDYVAGLNAGTYPNSGYTDWRVPNSKELHSLTDFSQSRPALPPGNPFTNINLTFYFDWSSTTDVSRPTIAWLVYMFEGSVVADNKSYSYNSYVWPVRGGHFGPVDHWAACGTVTGDVQAGVTLTLYGVDSDSTTSNGSGNYCFSGLSNGTYTVTPSLSGYTFTPTSRPVTINNGDITGVDFAATAIPYTISGTVTGAVQAGVDMVLSGTASMNTTTDSSGNYTFTGLSNGSYTVTPSKSGYIFSPPQNNITVSDSNLTGINFTASIPPGTSVNLPRTGQTKCYDTYGYQINCVGSGQDGEIAAGVAWPEPRFTDNGDGTMTDNLTGLMWTKEANLPAGTKNWQQALDYCNGLTLANHSDWRLSNVNELESLINANEPNSAAWLTTQGFTNVQVDWYLSSTTYAYYENNAWIVSIRTGVVSNQGKSNSFNAVWPVRGGQCGSIVDSVICLPQTGQTKCYDTYGTEIPCAGTGQDGDIQAGVAWPSPRFIDYGNGTVTDDLTSLMWTTNANLPNGPRTWQQALDYVKGMNSDAYPNFGFTDWRLPNRKEMGSLTDHSRYGHALPAGHPFTNVQTNPYWSSTTYVYDPGHAGWVSMWYGSVGSYDKSSSSYYVWPVRSPEPTLITLSSFTATPSDRTVILAWTTASEIDNADFNLYRSKSENGEYVKLNRSLIPADGSPTQGATYQFIDDEVQNRKTYYYKLEDIDLNGKSTMHDPVSATPRAIYNDR